MSAIPVLDWTTRPDGGPPPQLRTGSMVTRVRAPAGGEPLTVLRGRDEVTECITSRDWVVAGIDAGGRIRDYPLTGAERQDPDGGLLNMDGPPHRAYRRRIKGLFTLAGAGIMQADAESAAKQLAEGLRGRRTADLTADYADPFIAGMVCRSLGLPLADWPVILASSASAFAPVCGPEHVPGVDDHWREIYQFYGHVITAGRAHPDGTVTQITRALHGFTRGQVTHVLGNVSNGYPAARQSLRRMLWELLTGYRADLDACLRGEKTWGGVTRRLIDTVALFPVDLPRRAARDTWLDGHRFREGSLVVPSLAAAARDPRYPAPPKNIAFGYGPHTCPGGPLARMWLSCAAEVCFGFFPHARWAEEEVRWEGDSLLVPHQIMVRLR